METQRGEVPCSRSHSGEREGQDLNLSSQAPDHGSSCQPGCPARDGTGQVGILI